MLILERIANPLRELSGWRRLLVAMLIGALGALSLPPFQIFPALLLGYAALIVLLDGVAGSNSFGVQRWRDAALIGWSYGFGFFLVGTHWIGYAFLVNVTAHAWLLPFALVLFPSGLALFYALGAAICIRFWHSGAQRVFLFATVFGLGEWLRGHVFTGFPWNLPGYGWGASPAILQSAALFGVYGLSILTLLFGASLALFASRPRVIWLPATMATMFVLLWVTGALRLAGANEATVPNVQLRIVQAATPQSEKYVPQFVERNWRRLVDLTGTPADIPPTHVIWPEAAPPFVLMRDPVALREIEEVTGETRTLLTGAVRIDEANEEIRYYNSFYMFGARGELLATSDKFHLVPFGEYLPMEGALNALGITQIGGGVTGFSSGVGPRTFVVPGAPPVSPLICYEVIFPGAVTANPRPGWLVNMTDDSWFGPNVGPAQHLLIARVRAIEEGLPIARAANSGISAIVDGYGQIRGQLDLGRRGVLDGALPVALAQTPFGRYGETTFFALLLVLFGCALIPLRWRST